MKVKEKFDFMKTNKDNVKKLVRDVAILPIMDDLVNRVNKIVIHAYQFIKLYCSHLFKNKQTLPLIDVRRKKGLCSFVLKHKRTRPFLRRASLFHVCFCASAKTRHGKVMCYSSLIYSKSLQREKIILTCALKIICLNN